MSRCLYTTLDSSLLQAAAYSTDETLQLEFRTGPSRMSSISLWGNGSARHRLLEAAHLLEAHDAVEKRLHVDGPVALVGIQPYISVWPGFDDGSHARGVGLFRRQTL